MNTPSNFGSSGSGRHSPSAGAAVRQLLPLTVWRRKESPRGQRPGLPAAPAGRRQSAGPPSDHHLHPRGRSRRRGVHLQRGDADDGGRAGAAGGRLRSVEDHEKWPGRIGIMSLFCRVSEHDAPVRGRTDQRGARTAPAFHGSRAAALRARSRDGFGLEVPLCHELEGCLVLAGDRLEDDAQIESRIPTVAGHRGSGRNPCGRRSRLALFERAVHADRPDFPRE